MLTRCPHCQTAFRVTPDQIRARQGRVRCGRCQTVFDAIAALEDDAARAGGREVRPETPPSPPVHAAPRPEPLPEVAALELPVVAEAPTEAPATEPPTEEFPAEEMPPADVAEPAPEESTDADVIGLEPLLHVAETPRRRAWPWVLGLLVALVALALQVLVQLRVELAVLYPEFKPALLAVCEVFGCDVPLPRKIDLIGIETSDLHPDPDGSGRLQLAATLRNRAPFAQPYPDLEITLTDAGDQAQVRRVFAPKEYLPAEAAPAFAAKSEQPVNLLLEAPGVNAVGYRLYVFYP